MKPYPTIRRSGIGAQRAASHHLAMLRDEDMLVSTAEQIRDVRCVSRLRFFMTDIIVFSWWRGHSNPGDEFGRSCRPVTSSRIRDADCANQCRSRRRCLQISSSTNGISNSPPRGLLWVMTDKTRIEHNESAFGLIATKKSCDKGY